jgi:hypothetical protein
MAEASDVSPETLLMHEHTCVKGVAFRRKLITMMIEEQSQQPSILSSSGAFVDSLRAEPEMSHPNWAQDEMMRTKPCNVSWVSTRLPPTVWSPPPRQMQQAPPVVIAPPPMAGGGVPGVTLVAPPPQFPPSLCPFGVQFQDVISVQHRNH